MSWVLAPHDHRPISHVSETAVTLVGRNFGACWAVAALNLATSSADTRPRSFTLMPCALAHSGTSLGFSPLTDALRPARADRLPPPARRAAAPQPRSPPACHAAPGHARRSGRSPTRYRPARRGRRRRLCCHQGHRSAEPLLAEPYPPVPLTSLALAHRPSQVKPHKLQQHRKARPLQADRGLPPTAAGRVLRPSWRLQCQRADRWYVSRHAP